MLRWLVGALMAGLALLPACVDAQTPIPELTAHVVDTTGSLAPQQQAALESRLQQLEARKGSQVAVLLVPTTGSEPIESYTLRVAERWRVGRKVADDGALVVVATQDHRIRIEVGYGLEGALPDAIANRIITQTMVPRLRADDLPGALAAGVDAMIAAIDGESLPAAADLDHGPALPALLPLLFIGILVVGNLLRAWMGRLPGALAGGVAASAITWWVVGTAGIALAAGLAAAAMILGGGLGLAPLVFGRGAGTGFSGGGGRFGGGGASGRW